NLILTTVSGSQLVDAETLKQGIQLNLNSMLASQLQIGYMVGTGTPPYRGFTSPRDSIIVAPDLTNFYQLVTREYEIDGFFARNGVPEGLRTVLIVGPKGRFTDYELFQLDQFLMRGGSLIMFLDAYDIGISGNQATYDERRTGIEEMIEHYGVRLTRSYLLDKQSYVINDIDSSGIAMQIPIYSAPLITDDQINTDFPFLRNIDNMVFQNVSPVELVERMPENVTAFPLIQSSESAWVLAGDLTLENPFSAAPPPESQLSQYTIAYLLEGRFESYFAGRALPAPPVDGESDDVGDQVTAARDLQRVIAASPDFIPLSSGGQLIVIGASSVLGANILDAEGHSPASLFLLNAIDFMNGREGVAEMRAKASRIRPLEATTPFVRGFTKAFNIAGVPMIVVVVGLVVWLFYRARRRRVQRLFAGKT
ncbi:MAG: Gldg family protein, partial [Spirochaetia bacterium]